MLLMFELRLHLLDRKAVAVTLKRSHRKHENRFIELIYVYLISNACLHGAIIIIILSNDNGLQSEMYNIARPCHWPSRMIGEFSTGG